MESSEQHSSTLSLKNIFIYSLILALMRSSWQITSHRSTRICSLSSPNRHRYWSSLDFSTSFQTQAWVSCKDVVSCFLSKVFTLSLRGQYRYSSRCPAARILLKQERNSWRLRLRTFSGTRLISSSVMISLRCVPFLWKAPFLQSTASFLNSLRCILPNFSDILESEPSWLSFLPCSLSLVCLLTPPMLLRVISFLWLRKRLMWSSFSVSYYPLGRWRERRCAKTEVRSREMDLPDLAAERSVSWLDLPSMQEMEGRQWLQLLSNLVGVFLKKVEFCSLQPGFSFCRRMKSSTNCAFSSSCSFSFPLEMLLSEGSFASSTESFVISASLEFSSVSSIDALSFLVGFVFSFLLRDFRYFDLRYESLKQSPCFSWYFTTRPSLSDFYRMAQR